MGSAAVAEAAHFAALYVLLLLLHLLIRLKVWFIAKLEKEWMVEYPQTSTDSVQGAVTSSAQSFIDNCVHHHHGHQVGNLFPQIFISAGFGTALVNTNASTKTLAGYNSSS